MGNSIERFTTGKPICDADKKKKVRVFCARSDQHSIDVHENQLIHVALRERHLQTKNLIFLAERPCALLKAACTIYLNVNTQKCVAPA
jgi:hypothetical protein